jgi:hypothetical protein
MGTRSTCTNWLLVGLVFIICHGDEADPRLVWDSYRFGAQNYS